MRDALRRSQQQPPPSVLLIPPPSCSTYTLTPTYWLLEPPLLTADTWRTGSSIMTVITGTLYIYSPCRIPANDCLCCIVKVGQVQWNEIIYLLFVTDFWLQCGNRVDRSSVYWSQNSQFIDQLIKKKLTSNCFNNHFRILLLVVLTHINSLTFHIFWLDKTSNLKMSNCDISNDEQTANEATLKTTISCAHVLYFRRLNLFIYYPCSIANAYFHALLCMFCFLL